MIKPAKFFKALGDPTREKIMRLLRKHEELNVGMLTEKLHLAQPTVSQHLKILYEAGVVKTRKEGREVYYRICSTQVFDMIKTLLELYRGEDYDERG
jgi:DNA-binding transcriptional ArsR family regulator